MQMWIITTEGFYSVVAHLDDPDWLLVRARDDVDLKRLIKRLDHRFPKHAYEVHGEISNIRPSDYEFRIWVTRSAMEAVLRDITADIDYPNFKSAVHKVDHERAGIYTSLWGTLLRIGDKHRKGERRFGGGFDRFPLGQTRLPMGEHTKPVGAPDWHREVYGSGFRRSGPATPSIFGDGPTDEELEYEDDLLSKFGIKDTYDDPKPKEPKDEDRPKSRSERRRLRRLGRRNR